MFCLTDECCSAAAEIFQFENFVNHIPDVMLALHQRAKLPNVEKAISLIKVRSILIKKDFESI